jgi:hypothetical protein
MEKIDYDHEKKKKFWTLRNAVLLIHEINIPEHSYRTGFTISPIPINSLLSDLEWETMHLRPQVKEGIRKTIELVRDSVKEDTLILYGDEVKPPEFIRWALSKSIPVPDELRSLAQKQDTTGDKYSIINEQVNDLIGSSEIHNALFDVYRKHNLWPAAKRFLKRHNIPIEHDPSNKPRVKKSDLIAFDKRFEKYFKNN